MTTQRTRLSISEATSRLAQARKSAADAGSDPAKEAVEQEAAPTSEQQQDGLEPEVTHLDTEESDAGGSEGEEPEEEVADDDADGTDDAAKDPLYHVTVNGEEVEVPLSELLASYRRHGDYTRKTQALAEQRQAVESQAQEVNERAAALTVREQRLEQYDTALDALQQALATGDEEFSKIDWDRLAEDDPVEASRLHIKYERHKERKAQVEAEAKRRKAERDEEAKAAQRELVKGFQAEMAKTFPQWADEGVRNKDWADMIKTAKALGFKDAEIQSTVDSRIFRLLHQATEFDRIKAAKASAAKPAPKQAAQPSRVVQPSGARPVARAGNSSVRDAQARFGKTRSIHDAAALLQARKAAAAR